MESFVKSLKDKANRSLESFEKQLKILGFKKQRESTEEVKMTIFRAKTIELE